MKFNGKSPGRIFVVIGKTICFSRRETLLYDAGALKKSGGMIEWQNHSAVKSFCQSTPEFYAAFECVNAQRGRAATKKD